MGSVSPAVHRSRTVGGAQPGRAHVERIGGHSGYADTSSSSPAGHAELDQHIAAAVARPTNRGWRLDKIARDAQIDGAVALAMAVERAQHREPETQLVGWL